MSTRLSDLTRYREWQGFTIIPRRRIMNDCFRRAGATEDDLKPLTATVPTDGKTVMLGQPAYWTPMTIERAVEVLNSHKYLGRRWVPSDSKAEWADGAISVPRHFDNPAMGPGPTEYFNEFQAIAIAEKLEREAK